jgi:hypothetical protein
MIREQFDWLLARTFALMTVGASIAGRCLGVW